MEGEGAITEPAAAVMPPVLRYTFVDHTDQQQVHYARETLRYPPSHPGPFFRWWGDSELHPHEARVRIAPSHPNFRPLSLRGCPSQAAKGGLLAEGRDPHSAAAARSPRAEAPTGRCCPGQDLGPVSSRSKAERTSAIGSWRAGTRITEDEGAIAEPAAAAMPPKLRYTFVDHSDRQQVHYARETLRYPPTHPGPFFR